MNKPILCLDFDGVIHSYTSGWKGADVVPDPPVPGAMCFIWDASEQFTVAIHSSRSAQPGGVKAMRSWLERHFREHWAADRTTCDDKLAEIVWATEKPSAMVTLDDRAIPFNGEWPDVASLRSFKPWNKRECATPAPRVTEGRDPTQAALSDAWEQINALGGYRPTERNYEQGFVDAVSAALNLIEVLQAAQAPHLSTPAPRVTEEEEVHAIACVIRDIFVKVDSWEDVARAVLSHINDRSLSEKDNERDQELTPSTPGVSAALRAQGEE